MIGCMILHARMLGIYLVSYDYIITFLVKLAFFYSLVIGVIYCCRWRGLPIEGDGRMPRDRPGVGSHFELLIVAGGSVDRSLLRSVERYDTRNNTWSRCVVIVVSQNRPTSKKYYGNLLLSIWTELYKTLYIFLECPT